ncbi:MAG: hypothetical protein NUK65_07235 [Firmicutes bacterium]|nr:hypothetical protein [Bacillota bacterium]
MLVEVIKNIRAAEEKAEDIKLNAQMEARRIVREAQSAAVEAVEKSVAEASRQGRELMATAEKESESLIVPIQERTVAEIEQMVGAARSKQEAAIALVMERIVKSKWA